MAEGARLEIVCAETYRGFESRPLRQREPSARVVVPWVFVAVMGLSSTGFAQDREVIVLPPRGPTEPATLDVGLHAGVAARIGGSQVYGVESRGGIVFGGSVFLNPSPRFGVGVEFSHATIGSEAAGPGEAGEIELSRHLNQLWAGLRVHLLRSQGYEGWLGFGPGLMWQGVDASGVSVTTMGQPGQAFKCSASDGPRLGLRVGVGGAIPLGGGLHLAPEALLEGDQLTTDPLGTCAAGPGTTGVFSFRFGFFFRSDVSRNIR